MKLLREILRDARHYASKQINTAQLRRIILNYRSKIKTITLTDCHQLCLELFKTKKDGPAVFATAILKFRIDELKPEKFNWLDQYLDYFNDWGATDDFSINVLQPLLRRYKKEILQLLSMWNRSPNPWKRRASVVTFTRTIGESGQYTSEALKLCENLLHAPEDLVKKGLG